MDPTPLSASLLAPVADLLAPVLALDTASALTFVNALLVFLLLEWAALWLWCARRGRSARAEGLHWFLLAGAGLSGALRCALADAGLLPILACLALSGLSHAIDLVRRLKVAAPGAAASARQATPGSELHFQPQAPHRQAVVGVERGLAHRADAVVGHGAVGAVEVACHQVAGADA